MYGPGLNLGLGKKMSLAIEWDNWWNLNKSCRLQYYININFLILRLVLWQKDVTIFSKHMETFGVKGVLSLQLTPRVQEKSVYLCVESKSERDL